MGKSIINLSSVTTVGLDLAKHVFQVHGVDALGCVVVAKPIRRNKLLALSRQISIGNFRLRVSPSATAIHEQKQ